MLEYIDHRTGRGIRQLPWEQADPAVYEIIVEGDVVGHLSYDDGWRWLPDGPGTRFTDAHLLSLNDEAELEFEFGFEPDTLTRFADYVRKGVS